MKAGAGSSGRAFSLYALTCLVVIGLAAGASLARSLMDEGLDAARRLGHDIPDSFADFHISRSHSMGAYRPSSLIDWQLRRPVEVEAIWGEPWRQGVAAGASMPRVEMLYRLIQTLTKT